MEKYEVTAIFRGMSLTHVRWGNSDPKLAKEAFEREAKKLYGDDAEIEVRRIER